jgi:ribosomal peptide maturation radical SAM protein 1
MNSVAERVAILFMPFGGCTSPSLGISSLKGALCQKGFATDIHYFTIALAAQIGFDLYAMIAERLPPGALVGEWLFAPVLFGDNATADGHYVHDVLWGEWQDLFTPESVMELLHLRRHCIRFIHECLNAVAWSRYTIIGFSTSSGQNCASLALAWRIKQRFPEVKIVFGGPNCADPMGIALLDIFPFIDFVCPGEGEIAFPRLVEAVLGGKSFTDVPGIHGRAGWTMARRIEEDSRLLDLDALPYPDHTDYFAQLNATHADVGFIPYIPMETSRGCWRRAARGCTFCGVNGPLLSFRSKSASRVMEELRHTRDSYRLDVLFADTILDRHYFKTLLPDLARKMPGSALGWDIPSSLTRDEIALLARAGFTTLVPGIESFSDPILKLIRKETTSIQNIQTLKWCRHFGLTPLWNLLYGFPGEDPAEYYAMERLLLLLFHLPPPRCNHVVFQRHSEYTLYPNHYGIERLTPGPAYRWVYHSLSKKDVRRLAFYFDAEYGDDSRHYACGVLRLVEKWRATTEAVLDVFPVEGSILIVDTRISGQRKEYRFYDANAHIYLACDAARSFQELVNAPLIRDRITENEVAAILDYFIEKGLMIREGGLYLSLGIIQDSDQPPKEKNDEEP